MDLNGDNAHDKAEGLRKENVLKAILQIARKQAEEEDRLEKERKAHLPYSVMAMILIVDTEFGQIHEYRLLETGSMEVYMKEKECKILNCILAKM